MKPTANAIVRALVTCGGHNVSGDGQVYPDTWIHHWGEVYLANPRLKERGILFATFLAYPEAILRAVVYADDPDAEAAVLEHQARVRAALDHELEVDRQIAALEQLLQLKRMRVADGRAIEPLHHRAHPRHAKARQEREVGAL